MKNPELAILYILINLIKKEQIRTLANSMFINNQKNLLDTSMGIAERILQSLQLNEEEYNYVKNQVALSGVTNEYGIMQEIKKILGDKNIPFGPVTSGGVSFSSLLDENPYSAGVKNIDDQIKFEAAFEKLSEDEKRERREAIGGPPSILNPYKEKNPLEALTGNIELGDDEFRGRLTYKPKNMFSLGTTFTDADAQWYAQLQSEDEKNRLKFTGQGPKLDKVQANIGPVTATYGLDTDAWKAELAYPLTESGNLRLKGDIGSDDSSNLGLYYKGTWGPKREIIESQYKQPSELEKVLRKYETYAKGGVAHLLGE